MPVFSCGGMRYQQDWSDLPLASIAEANQRNLVATIERALELGINHIETARGYGTSERQLGLVLPKFDRDKIIVQTKVAPNADAAQFREHVLDSLKRLQLDYVDLLGIHGVNTWQRLHWVRAEDGCLAAARALQREGYVRHVGFSTHGSTELIREVIALDDHNGFDYINLHWYYIFQDNWTAIEHAAQRDMGVFIISPSDKGGMLYRPSDKLIRLCDPLHPLVFNCLFCLTRPEVHTLSLGASCPGDFELQCSALPMLKDGETPRLLARIEDRLTKARQEVLGADIAAHGLDGIPPWDQMPNYINARTILWLRQLAMSYDMMEYAQTRYDLLGRGGHWLPGTNAAQVEQVDLSKALSKAAFAKRIPAWLAEAHTMLVKDKE